jgi:hypothetical protein
VAEEAIVGENGLYVQVIIHYFGQLLFEPDDFRRLLYAPWQEAQTEPNSIKPRIHCYPHIM